MINKLSIYPHPSFYLHSPPFGGVGGGYSERGKGVFVINVLLTNFYPSQHQQSEEHSKDKPFASPR